MRVLFFISLILFSVIPAAPAQKKKGDDKPARQGEFHYHLHEASRSKMEGKMMEAILHLNRALEINPKSAAAHYELAGLYMHMGDLKKGRELASEAIKLNPNQEWYRILLSELYKASGMYKEATREFENLIRLSPSNSEYYFQRADLFHYMKKYDDALKEYDRIEKNFGFSESLALAREELWLQKGDENKALEEIRKLVTAYPNEPRYLGILAETYMNRQNYTEAWKYYQKMMESDSTNGLLHLSLAEYYRLTRDYDKSFSELKKAFAAQDVDIQTKVRMLVTMITYVNSSPELKEQVYALIQILLETHPDEPESHAFHADFLINEKQYEQARNELRIVVQSEKKQYMIWEQLLILNSQLNDFTSLLDDSELALTYFPNQPMIYYFKGLALYSLKRDSEAIPALTTGVEMVLNNDPLRLQFYNLLAESCNRSKDHECSDKYMEKALQLDPQNLPLLNNFAYYLSLRKSQLEKAEKMSRITIEVERTNATYLDTYAWILFQQGKYDEALIQISEAIQHGGSGNPVITEHYGDILYKNGKKEEALAQWEKARSLGQGSALLEKKIAEKRLIEE